ncbi:uncharacterized protein EAE97_011082 [Botrytis byssoidea]|uniref:Uncharacterized protein n=1 Tax=Botrytis byssoidea TaxID=139641 RepID=A0A9P5HZ11_9HELO|nr:uncharacterized protein EAE97_011082 [Botrytis byssoidea]KAF7922340.1 hypothetical protein EAE97_011082 [Botrytis byssoidea]
MRINGSAVRVTAGDHRTTLQFLTSFATIEWFLEFHQTLSFYRFKHHSYAEINPSHLFGKSMKVELKLQEMYIMMKHSVYPKGRDSAWIERSLQRFVRAANRLKSRSTVVAMICAKEAKTFRDSENRNTTC